MLRWFLPALLLLTGTACMAQPVKWSATRKLAWNDYTRVADSLLIGDDALFSAVTLSYYGYSLRPLADRPRQPQSVLVSLYTGFNKKASGVKNSVFSLSRERQDYLLSHEQLHFDLAEIYRRMMVADMTEKKFSRNYAEEIKEIVANRQKAFNQEQLRYDGETAHGADKEAQAAWTAAVQQRLHDTEKYASTDFVIKFL